LCTIVVQFESFDDLLTFIRWTKCESDVDGHFLWIHDFETSFRCSANDYVSELKTTFFFTVNAASNRISEVFKRRKISNDSMFFEYRRHIVGIDLRYDQFALEFVDDSLRIFAGIFIRNIDLNFLRQRNYLTERNFRALLLRIFSVHRIRADIRLKHWHFRLAWSWQMQARQ